MHMILLPRAPWFFLFGLSWAALVLLAWFDVTLWVHLPVALLALAFILLTDAEPGPCDCPMCAGVPVAKAATGHATGVAVCDCPRCTEDDATYADPS